MTALFLAMLLTQTGVDGGAVASTDSGIPSTVAAPTSAGLTDAGSTPRGPAHTETLAKSPCDNLHPSRFTTIQELEPPWAALEIYKPEDGGEGICSDSEDPADGRAGRFQISERAEIVLRFNRNVVPFHGGLSVKAKVGSNNVELPGYAEIGKPAPVSTRVKASKVVAAIREFESLKSRLVPNGSKADWIDFLVVNPRLYRGMFLDALDAQASNGNTQVLARLHYLAEAGRRAVDSQESVLKNLRAKLASPPSDDSNEAMVRRVIAEQPEININDFAYVKEFQNQLAAYTAPTELILEDIRAQTNLLFPPVAGNEYWPEVRFQPKAINARAGEVIEIEIVHTPNSRLTQEQQPPSIGWKLRFLVEKSGFYVDTSAKLNLVWTGGYSQPDVVHGAQGMLVPGVGVDFLYFATSTQCKTILSFIFSGGGIRVDYLDFDSSQAIELGLAASVLFFRGIVSFGVGYNMGIQNPRFSDRGFYFAVGLGVDKVLDQAQVVADFFRQ